MKHLALILAALLVALPAAAQQKKIGGPVGHVLDQIQGGQPQGSNDGPGAASTGGNAVGSLLDKPFQDLANFIGDDIDAAITLSTSVPTLQDGNGQRCLMAFKTFGTVIKAHPAPLTFKIASDLEAFRLKQAAVNNLCQEEACTVVFDDFTQTITALAPVPLPVPSLHDLCSKVPTIKLVAPVATATAPVITTPTPSPAPTTPQ
jgi:hypothetical protein